MALSDRGPVPFCHKAQGDRLVEEQELEQQEGVCLIPNEIDAQLGRGVDHRGGVLGGLSARGLFHVKVGHSDLRLSTAAGSRTADRGLNRDWSSLPPITRSRRRAPPCAHKHSWGPRPLPGPFGPPAWLPPQPWRPAWPAAASCSPRRQR